MSNFSLKFTIILKYDIISSLEIKIIIKRQNQVVDEGWSDRNFGGCSKGITAPALNKTFTDKNGAVSL